MDGRAIWVRGLVCPAVIVLGSFHSAVPAKYASGSGTADDPYLIRTPEQMRTVGLSPEDWDKCFTLEADLDLAETGESPCYPIGSLEQPFAGVFDGNGHTLSNLRQLVQEGEPQQNLRQHVGLFGVVDGPEAQIKSLGLIDPRVEPASTCPVSVWMVGALAGYLRSGSIVDCYVDGGRVAGDRWIGGLVGCNGGTITRCWTTGIVLSGPERSVVPLPANLHEDRESFGGLVGENNGEIRSCHSTATVQGRENVGGLAGSHRRRTIADSWTRGNVSAIWAAGGLVGFNSVDGVVLRCYAAAQVRADQTAGGLIGKNNAAYVRESWAGGDVAGDLFVGGLIGLNTDERTRTGALSGSTTDCYATARVCGFSTCGGLIGGNALTVARCYAVGEVLTSDPNQEEFTEFGLVGSNRMGVGVSGIHEGVIDSCFWDVQTTGHTSSRGGGVGLATGQMQTPWTYFAAGWDLASEAFNGAADTWNVCSGRAMYPRLAWEAVRAGDFVDPAGIGWEDLAFLAEHWLQKSGVPCINADLTFDSYVDMRDFRRLARYWRQGARKVIFETPLDLSPGWTTEGQWQFGTPTGGGETKAGYPDPVGGHTGGHVYGVNLRGDYGTVVDGPHYLTAGPFDCRAYREIRLEFARWLNTDEARYVRAAVEMSRDGAIWTVLWTHRDLKAILADDHWQVVAYDLGPMADCCESLYLRWSYGVVDDEAWAMSGWNIDDIVISGVAD